MQGKRYRRAMKPVPVVPAIVCGAVVAMVVALALLSLHANPSRAALRSGALSSLMRQSARYSVLADQDSNALISMLHATYSLAYCNAARKLASDQTLRRLTHIDASELANAADAKQQRALAHINQGCPDMAVHSDQLRLAGWLE